MFPEQPYEEYRLSPGSSLMVLLPAASELRCLQGQARVVPAPQAIADALCTLARTLSAGQAYRASHDQWVTLEGAFIGTQSRLACTRHMAAPQKKSRLATQVARRLQYALEWLRRAPRAASSRIP
ncbi:MAG TPA: hypothetical protein VLJ57_14715 [Burkholderiaceae bacterium]|nr:hypothetical protein [Burkholderiaceae bacterium]